MVSYSLWWVSVVGIKDGVTHFYIFTQWISPFNLWVSPKPLLHSENTTTRTKVCQWLVTSRLLSKVTPVSSTDKTDHQDITDIVLKAVLVTINSLSVDYIWKWLVSNLHWDQLNGFTTNYESAGFLLKGHYKSFKYIFFTTRDEDCFFLI